MLSGSEIVKGIARGDIIIQPFDSRAVNPNSINVTLGDTLLELIGNLDMRLPSIYNTIKIPPEGYELQPGVGYLGHTVEVIGSDRYGSTYCGRSSTGRLFIKSQVDAGHIDAGFIDQLTLELEVTMPCRIYAGVHIGQLIFHEITGEIDMLYKGNYVGQVGPRPSAMWKGFLK